MNFTYESIKQLTEGEEFPVFFQSQNGEFGHIRAGHDGESSYYIVKIAQDNGWLRVKTYYDDGTVTEEYER